MIKDIIIIGMLVFLTISLFFYGIVQHIEAQKEATLQFKRAEEQKKIADECTRSKK